MYLKIYELKSIYIHQLLN